MLKEKPNSDIQISGFELNASKLRNDETMVEISEDFKNFDSPANLGGLEILIVVVLNPTQAPSPRKKLWFS